MTDLDSKHNDFEKRLNDLIDRHREVSPNDAIAYPSASDAALDHLADPGPDLEARFREWDQRLEARLREHRGQATEAEAPPSEAAPFPAAAPPMPDLPAARSPHPPLTAPEARPFPPRNATLGDWLAGIDRVMLSELGLERLPRPPGFDSPIRIVESDAEMRRELAQVFPDGAPGGLDDLSGHRLGTVHIPGVGTLVNFQHFSGEHDLDDFEHINLKARAELISEVACERWGWGYLLEYTTLGQEAGQIGLWPALAANRLGLADPRPQQAALCQALCRSWALTAAGWEDWIWQYVLFKARSPAGEKFFHRPRPGGWMELLSKIVNLFPLFILPFGVRIRLLNLIDLFKFLFLEEGELGSRTINSVIAAVQKFCREHDLSIAVHIGIPFSRFLGRIYFARLEANIGIQATPYALLIVLHDELLDLRRLASDEALLRSAAEEPRANPDTRLALLSSIDSRVRYDPRSMFIAAWERLHLNGPEGIFR